MIGIVTTTKLITAFLNVETNLLNSLFQDKALSRNNHIERDIYGEHSILLLKRLNVLVNEKNLDFSIKVEI